MSNKNTEIEIQSDSDNNKSTKKNLIVNKKTNKRLL